MMAFDYNSLAHSGAERLINGAIYGSVAALGLWFAQPRLKRYQPSLRFAILFLGLIVVGVFPLLLSVRAGASNLSASSSELYLPGVWASRLLLLWVVGAGLGLVRISHSLLRLRQLCGAAQVVAVENLPGLLQTTAREFGSRGVSVSVSHEVRIPVAVGIFAPMVIFPSWSWRDLSAEELNAILLHELAHLRRWDDWTNLAQQVMKALLFFHPAVWWIESKLTLEREMACDAFVVEKTANASGYARCLVSLAEHSLTRRTFALAHAAVGKVKQISMRVSQMLEVQSGHLLPSRAWLAAAFAGATAVVIAGASYMPELVSFKRTAPVTTMVADSSPAFSVTPTLASVTQVSVMQKDVITKATVAVHRHPVSPRTLEAVAPSIAEKSTPVPIVEAGLKSPIVQTVYLIYDAPEISPSGEIMFRWNVMQLTVYSTNPAAVQSQLPAKKI
jgi:beta-lactamase regulating signal transducer with metallopeptidase domain